MRRLYMSVTVVVLVLLALPPGGNAGEPEGPAPLFADSVQSLGNSVTQAVAAADLDHDGDIDVFAANDGANRVWLNDGSGGFSGSGQNLSLADSRDVVLAHLDLDGHIDAVVANFDAPNQVWWNDGNGNFTAGPTFASNNSRGVAVADLDGDARQDIYIAEDGTDHIYFNNGDRTFTDSGQAVNLNAGYAVALGDLDSDGDRDVFVANGSNSNNSNTVWINQAGLQGGSQGTFLDSGQQLDFNWTEDVKLGRLDGVPGIDAFTANWFPNANKVWGNDGSANFADSGQSLGAEASLGVALADVDEDGDLDAVVGNNTPDGVRVWLNDGSGGFNDSGQSIGADTTVYDVAIHDFNGDGAPDLFLGAFGPNRVWLHTDPEPTVPVPGFQPQIVDSRGDAGDSTAIALDSSGFPHIAYTAYQLHRQGLNWGIRYARWDGIRWRFELVDLVDSISTGDHYAVDIALDSAGEPRIAIATSDDVRYAERQGGVWNVETVYSEININSQVAMALDSLDRPHVVFQDPSGVFHVYFDGANWLSEEIDPDPFFDSYPDIVIDDSDTLHVSYYNSEDDAIEYASNVGGVWQSEIVEAGIDLMSSSYISLDVDSAGNPGIAFQRTDEEVVKLAHRDGAMWTIETVRSVPGDFRLNERLGLAFGASDIPHIVFAPGAFYLELTHMFRDGAEWIIRVIEQSPDAGPSLSMALDANGDPHVSYYDRKHQSLRYVRWGEEFALFNPDPAASVQAASLGVRNGAPAIGFYDTNSGQIEIADWQDPWQFDGIGFSSAPVGSVSAVAFHSNLHVSHYDADNQRLIYTRWDGAVETAVVVDETGDVGASNDITIVGQNDGLRRIAYWDASNHWVRLALLNHNNPPVLHVNDQAPALNAASGHVSITELANLDVAVSYYDGVNGDLRLGIWNSATNNWVDHLVAGDASEAGRYHDLRTDATTGVPVMAYYDDTAEQIRLAYGSAPPFTDLLAVANVSGLNSLSLSLNLDSRRESRIVYTTSDGSQYLAFLENGVWRVKILAEPSASVLDQTAMALQDRMHFAFASSLDGLMYGQRIPNLDFAELPGESPTLGDGFYNPMDACLAFGDLFFDDDEAPGRVAAEAGLGPDGPQGPTAPLSDEEIFAALAGLFNATEGGQFYIDLYSTHGSEMGRIALDDPVLAWDSYGVLQRFLPGLEALVTGSGNDLLIDQDMVDRALDFWTRTAAAGSPELEAAFNAELAKYNNLQDFVGLSFDEWANAIGVSTPAQLEVIFQHGFE